jgi:hypothetical protein
MCLSHALGRPLYIWIDPPFTLQCSSYLLPPCLDHLARLGAHLIQCHLSQFASDYSHSIGVHQLYMEESSIDLTDFDLRIAIFFLSS